MNEIKYLNLVARDYEIMLKKNPQRAKDELDFFIDQMNQAITQTKQLQETASDDIQNWAEAIQTVSEVDDANTWLQKLELKMMKRHVDKRYHQSLVYSKQVADVLERLEVISKRLYQIKAFSH